jgi:hypothetical protein
MVPRVVGASYAALVAEQLFASGCTQLVSVTSAGVVDERRISKRFALITDAVRGGLHRVCFDMLVFHGRDAYLERSAGRHVVKLRALVFSNQRQAQRRQDGDVLRVF